MSNNEAAKLTILVVEDEELVRLTIVEFLRGSDCDVIEAASGEAAVALLRRNDRIDAVFTDIQLGGEISGWEVAEASRLTCPDIPVIYTSGGTIVSERSVGGSVFLQKPYDPAAVLLASQALCEERAIA